MTTNPAKRSFDAIVERQVSMFARDGVRLVMDIHRPAAEGNALPGRFPVLLERTPYGRSISRIADFGVRAAQAGYVFASQDVRGRGDSGGHFHMLTNKPDEGQDGFDTMRWLVSQPWCDGRIGTVGGSFSAANQQAMALYRPPGLRAQMLRDAGTNYYRRMLRYHGAFNVGMLLPWVLRQAIDGHEAQADPDIARVLSAMRDNLGDWLDRLPLRRGASPLALCPEYEDIYFTLLETADDVPYWHNPTARLDGRWDEYPTDVAVLLVSGWFAHHAAANFDKLRELGRRLRRPVRLIVGPWIHGPDMLEATTAGEVDFGPAAALHGPRYDRWLEWFDRNVLGEPEPAGEPRLHYFVMGGGSGRRGPTGLIDHGGVWRSANAWPLPRTRFQPFHLRADRSLTPEAPDHAEGASSYVFDPADPTPGIGATNLQAEEMPAFVLPGPRVQVCRPDFAACRGSDRPLSERADILTFETAPLDRDTEVTGDLLAHLWVSTSAPDTDFAVRLSDVYPPSAEQPDGMPLLISEGMLRLRYRDDRPVGALAEPGEIYPITIELGPTSNVFKQGHRIQLCISSASFPQYDVNPNTGEALGFATGRQPATQVIFHDALRPSHISLPLQPCQEGSEGGLSN